MFGFARKLEGKGTSRRWAMSFLLLACGVCAADTVVMTNGRTLEGIVTAEESGRIQLEQQGIKMWIKRSGIQSIHRASPEERDQMLADLRAPQPHDEAFYPEPARGFHGRLQSLDALRKEALAGMEKVEGTEKVIGTLKTRYRNLTRERAAVGKDFENAKETLNKSNKSSVEAYNRLADQYNRLAIAQSQVRESMERRERERESLLSASTGLLARYDTACRELGRLWWQFLDKHPPGILPRGEWFDLLSKRLDKHPARAYVRDPMEVAVTTDGDGTIQVKLSADERGHFMVPATLNGTTGVDLMLDTGASITTISAETARAAKVEVVGPAIRVQVADGRQIEVLPGILRQLAICGVVFSDEPVGILPDHVEEDAQGLLGMTLLRQIRFNVSKDVLWMEFSTDGPPAP